MQEIFNHLLGADRSSNESNQVVDLDLPQITLISPFQATGSQKQYDWQIK